jgi:hypothetical protein
MYYNSTVATTNGNAIGYSGSFVYSNTATNYNVILCAGAGNSSTVSFVTGSYFQAVRIA